MITMIKASGVVSNRLYQAAKYKKKRYIGFYLTLGCLIGSLLRLVFHIISDTANFESSVPEGQLV